MLKRAKMHFVSLVCPLPMWEVVLGVRNALPTWDWPSPSLEVRSSLIARRSSLISIYIQLCAPKVVAMAVRMVMRMLRTLPQVELLLNVPIVLVGF